MHFETRIFKTSEVLISNGIVNQITLLGRSNDYGNLLEEHSKGILIRRLYTPFIHSSRFLKVLFFSAWLFWVLAYLILKRPQILNIHSASLLPFAGLQRILNKKCHIIYDAHELETETNNISPLSKVIKKTFEKYFINSCHHTFVVSPMIRDWYINKYQITNINVLLNAPKIKTSSGSGVDVRKKFNLTSNDFIVSYVGLLAKGRGIEVMLEMADDLNNDLRFLFIGFGPEKYNIINHPQFGKKIFYLEPQPQDILIETLRSVDFGFSYYHPSCLSLDYSLPNKFFEYLNAGVPVIVGRGKQLKKILFEYEIGIVVDDESLMAHLQDEMKTFSNKKNLDKEIHRFISDFNWEKNSEEMLEIYKNLSDPIDNNC